MLSGRPRPLSCAWLGAFVLVSLTGCDSTPAERGDQAASGAKPSKVEPSEVEPSKVEPSKVEPAATEVCGQLAAALAEAGETEAAREQLERDCVVSLTQVQGRYASLTTCLLAAKDLAAVEACERPSVNQDPILRSLVPSTEKLCAHALGLANAELGQEFDKLSEAESERIVTSCTANANAEKAKLGTVAYRAKATCMLAAKTLDEFEQCEA